jgi:15-cis-phytoene synthase
MQTIKINAALGQRAQAVMNKHAKSFSWAAYFLSPSARREAALLYAFARAADDFADEEALGPLNERMALLKKLQQDVLQPSPLLEPHYANEPENTIASAVRSLLRHHRVNRSVLLHFMHSLEADSLPRQLESTQDLLTFAYGVAGTVGQMMRPILGAPAHAEAYATALGVAMQLTNIARDVVEDARRGRCYLPAQWGAQMQSVAFPNTTEQRTQAFQLIEKLLALADDFYAYAGQGIHHIAPGNQRAIRIALSLYRGIGQKILRQGSEYYWRGRTHLTPYEKGRLIIAVTLGRSQPVRKPARNVVASDLSHLHKVPGFYSQV